MYTTVENYCTSCEVCAKRRLGSPRPIAPLGSLPTVNCPFERVAVDVVGPFPETTKGNKVLVVFIDHFTKWSEAFAVPNQEAKTIARLLVTEIISRYSIPKELLSDRGTNFLSKIVAEVCELFKIKKLATTAYNPKCNGGVERHHRVIMDGLAKYCGENQKDWDEHINLVLFAYRVVRHSTTMKSPFFLLQGRDPQLSINRLFLQKGAKFRNAVEYRERLLIKLEGAFQIVKNQLVAAHEYQKKYYDKKTKLRHFDIGEKVYLHNTACKIGVSPKLTKTNWKGPYRIMEKKSDLTYRIRHCNTWKEEVVNINRLKLAVERILPTEERQGEKRESDSKLLEKQKNSRRSNDKTKHVSFWDEDTSPERGHRDGEIQSNKGEKEEQKKSLPVDQGREEENKTMISPSNPRRVVDRAIEILEKALQGMPWEGNNSTEKAMDEGQSETDLHEPLEETREGPRSWADDEKWRQSTPDQSKSEGYRCKEDELFQGTSPILAENITAAEISETANQEPGELEEQDENNPTDGYVTRRGRITKKPDFYQAGGK